MCGFISGLSTLSMVVSFLMTVAVEYSLKSGNVILPALFFFLKTTLAILGLLCFHRNCKLFCSDSVKNTPGNLRDCIESVDFFG